MIPKKKNIQNIIRAAMCRKTPVALLVNVHPNLPPAELVGDELGCDNSFSLTNQLAAR
jgi:hypothetical protein